MRRVLLIVAGSVVAVVASGTPALAVDNNPVAGNSGKCSPGYNVSYWAPDWFSQAPGTPAAFAGSPGAVPADFSHYYQQQHDGIC